jgi:hypothetical protein
LLFLQRESARLIFHHCQCSFLIRRTRWSWFLRALDSLGLDTMLTHCRR